MRALGKEKLPREFRLGPSTYRLERTVKHDFFAATGFYADAQTGRRVVLKVSRTAEFAGFPLRWLGRALCLREMRFYAILADLPNVPRLLGAVGPTGFVHEFVPARPLSAAGPVPAGFFDQVGQLLLELRRRGIAYVDTNKPENILLGDDGRPHLIDFQISFDRATLGGRPAWLNRLILGLLHREDLYHLLKHKRRLCPDELTNDERRRAARPSAWIRLHRFLFRPYFAIRRRTFKRLRDTGHLLPEGSK
jgi:hypothetical protein